MLIDDIKPEILVKLDKNYEKYNLCVNNVYDKLSTKCIYGQLDVSDVRDIITFANLDTSDWQTCLLYTSPSLRDRQKSRMPSSA